MKAFIILALSFFILCYSLRSPQVINGDAREYIIQTQSIALNHELRIDREKIAEYWNRTNPFLITLSPGSDYIQDGFIRDSGGFGALFSDRFVAFRYVHYFAYSLLAAPFYALWHWIAPGGGEYQSFRILNSLLLSLPILLILRRRRDFWSGLTALLLALSPMAGYTGWHSPEVMCFSLCLAAFLLLDDESYSCFSPILLGIAASHYLPLLVFFSLELLLLFRFQGIRVLRKASFWSTHIIGVLLAVSAPFYYWAFFGVPSLFAAIGVAQPAFASSARALDLFVNPFSGGLWAFCIFIFLAIFKLSKKNFLFSVFASAVAFLCAFLCSSVDNFNSAYFVVARYSTWLITPIIAISIIEEWPDWKIEFRQGLFICFSLVAFFYFGLERILWNPNEAPASLFSRRVARIVKLFHYEGGPETFGELVQGREYLMPHEFRGIYIWNVDKRHSIWLVSRRGLDAMQEQMFRVPGMSTLEVSYPFTERQGAIIIDRRASLNWQNDTRLGDYAYLWLNAPVAYARSNIPIFVK